MLVNEVCRECKLTKKAVEYYVGQGLISPAVMENGYRRFSEADAAKLKKIAVLRGLGLSVPDIRRVLEEDGLPAVRAVAGKKELEIAGLQAKQTLIRQLADSGDWDRVRAQMDALQKKQAILTRILDRFPGSYGKFVCLHFAPFLGEPAATEEQQHAFETIIRFLDEITFTVPEDLQDCLDEWMGNPDAALAQNASAALASAMDDPERYIRENREMLEQYRAITESEEYRASPAYRLRECIKQFQRESGYQELFLPAMQRLSPSYREYCKALQAANRTFLKHYEQHTGTLLV